MTSKIKNKDLKLIKNIRKRDFSEEKFDPERIYSAVLKAFSSTGEGEEKEARKISDKVVSDIIKAKKEDKNFMPTVEEIQDWVEQELILEEFVRTAKAYILYRSQRSQMREKGAHVPEKVQELADKSKQYFRNPLGEFVYYRTYSRWIEEEGRRETWIETVDRYISFMKENLGDKLKDSEYEEVRESILRQEVMPSMRLLQFAGPAARKTNVCAYNCSFIAPSKIQDFAEIMYISMCGTGAGFSVESKNIQALPQVQIQTGEKLKNYVVPDSKEGWCDALAFGMKTWFEGKDVEFDYSQLRPSGARLRTMGGKSSGPEPLRQLLEFVKEKLLRKQGKRLSNLDAHDIICKIGEVVVAGGVRRSALISLSDLDDSDIRDAKKGQFWNTEPQRALANNSAVYEKRPNNEEFLEEWMALIKSGSGERGIFNRGGLKETLPKRRLDKLEGDVGQLGTNPCGEIILKSKQFCNLSEVVARSDDTEETLARKVRVATILGTYQATLTKFPYLSKKWKENCQQERLLGVSITGQWDCPVVRDSQVLEKLRKESIKENKKYAKKFGIEQSTCITCVKPSGNLSQVVDCSSGMHPRYAPYYIRRIRIASTDSLFQMLKDQGMPYYPEVGQSAENATTYVLEFPVKSPKNSIYSKDLSALDQLEHWKLVKKNFTEHNPSVTIQIDEDEWIEVANWLYNNWQYIGGLSFLPKTKHVYQLAPYEEIDEKRYKELHNKMKDINFAKIVTYEKSDETEVKKELACVSGACEII